MAKERGNFNGASNLETCPYCKGTGKAAATPAMRFRAIREKHGLSQDQMAAKVNISRTQIVNIEAGRSDPGLSLLMRSADEFSVSVDWLLGRSP